MIYIISKLINFFYILTKKIFIVFIFFKDKKNYHQYRANLLRNTIFLLNHLVDNLNYEVPILIKNKKPYLDLDGVILGLNISNRYLKINQKDKYYNQAKYAEELFKFQDGGVFIDVGACIGEYSIYLAQKYKNSHTHSIEADPKNYDIFIENLNANKFSGKIETHNIALSDFDGQKYSINHNRQESDIIINSENNLIDLPETQTLNSFLKNFKITKVEFIKIDIESSNYKLVDCLIKNLDKFKAIQYEFAKGNKEKFIQLIEESKKKFRYYVNVDNQLIETSAVDLILKINNEVDINSTGLDVYFKQK